MTSNAARVLARRILLLSITLGLLTVWLALGTQAAAYALIGLSCVTAFISMIVFVGN